MSPENVISHQFMQSNDIPGLAMEVQSAPLLVSTASPIIWSLIKWSISYFGYRWSKYINSSVSVFTTSNLSVINDNIHELVRKFHFLSLIIFFAQKEKLEEPCFPTCTNGRIFNC